MSVGATADAVRDRAADVRNRVEDRVQHTKDRLEIPIHRHPFESLAIAAGVGLLVGFAMGVLQGRKSS